MSITSSLNYDLHSHTSFSDGVLTPCELVDRAVKNEVNVLAITDHDTIEGINEAQNYICTNHLPIKLIDGVEISTSWNSNEIHIVGLNININNTTLIELLNKQQSNRIERAIKIGDKLAKVSVMNAYEKTVAEYAKNQIVSRSHFARFLVDNKYVPDIKRAFKKYLGKSGYAYVTIEHTTIENAISVIHQAGGIAVLAHPSRYDFTLSKMKTLIRYFKQHAGDGIEVSQSRQTLSDLMQLAKLANEFELLASQGSDFHGLNSYLDLGKTTPLPDNIKPVWYNWS